MLDFRYHALTLMAVLVSLVIGLLLGVAIGDEGLVSGAERELRAGLRSDVESARGTASELRDELERRERYEELTYGAVVDGRLAGRRVAVLTLNQPSSETFDAVRSAIPPAGGDVSFVGRLRTPPDLERLADAASGTRYDDVAEDPDLITPLATRIGQQLAAGGRLPEDAREQLFAASSGTLAGAEAVVLIRDEPPEDRPAEEVEREDAFVRALIDGIESYGTPVVGAERTSTDPSQVEWYRDHGLPSVDNVDQPAGQAALVLALAGAGDGAYGVKPTAEAILPEALVRTP